MTIQQHASFDSSAAELNATSKLVKAWESKNAKNAARAGGISMMALSLAACGGSSTTTTATTDTTATDTTTTTTVVTPSAMDLTIAADTGTAFTGTSAADTIDGSLDSGNQTLHGFDTIDGAGGTDTLTATIGSTLTVEPTLTSVEVVNLQFTAAGTLSLDAAPGVTDLKVYASTAATAVTNIESNVNLTLEDVVGGNTAAFTFKADAVGSATSALTLNTDGSTATVDINVSGADVYTTATVNSTGSASVLTLDALDTVTGLTVTGDAALTLASTDGFSAITSIDSSTFTGAFTMDLDDAATAYSLTLGSGVDTITADTANTGTGGRTITMGAGDDVLDLGDVGAEADDVFTGGDGTDTLIINDETDVELALTAGVSGFERLVASETAKTYVLTDFSNDQDFTIVRANAAVITFTGGRNVTTLEVNAANDTTASFARLTDGTTDSLTIKVVGTGAADVDTISAVDEESITIDVNAADLGTTAQAVALTSTDLTSLTIVGDNDVYLGALSGAAVSTVDATGLSGVLTVSAVNATTSVTFTTNGATSNTGGATLTGGGSDDTFTGTANVDYITGGGGNDTITTGAGADTIRLDDVAADTVTDFTTGTGGDEIEIDHSDYGTVVDGDGTVTAGTANVELVTGQETLGATDSIIVLSGTTYATAALAGAAIENGGARQVTASAAALADNDIVLFVYSNGTDAYLVEGIIDNASSATTIDAGGLTESVVLTLSGLDSTEIGTLVSANFDFV